MLRFWCCGTLSSSANVFEINVSFSDVVSAIEAEFAEFCFKYYSFCLKEIASFLLGILVLVYDTRLYMLCCTSDFVSAYHLPWVHLYQKRHHLLLWRYWMLISAVILVQISPLLLCTTILIDCWNWETGWKFSGHWCSSHTHCNNRSRFRSRCHYRWNHLWGSPWSSPRYSMTHSP